MSAERLADLKAFMHVDHDEDDSQIIALYRAAEAYLAKAGIAPSEDELYYLAVDSLTLEWYDAGGPSEALSVGLRQIINQFKLDGVAQMPDPVF